MRRPAFAVLAVVLVVAVSGCSRGGRPVPSAPSKNAVVVDLDGSPTDRQIARAQTRLRSAPDDPHANLELAVAFLQKAREVADPTYYSKADGLLAEVERRRPGDPQLLIAKGSLALARHRFPEAYDLGRRAVAAAPFTAEAYGVVVDAANELGRYDEALDATQKMVDIKPNLASLSRVSYARELRGDLHGAVAAMAQARQAGSRNGENVAYVEVKLGDLLLTTGDLAGAEQAYARADIAFPGFAAAKAGRGRVMVARGRVADAAGLLAEVVRVQPLAEHAIAHADALAASGRDADARTAYDLVGAIARLYSANGVNVDLEVSLFEADHQPGPDAVSRARRALAERPGVHAHDALAWNLYGSGTLDEAWAEAGRAVALGSRDPQIRFHAAAIALARGDRETAAAHLGVVLSTNPRFSAVHARRVVAMSADLGLPVPAAAQ